jgi:hypothetical protein
LKKYNGKIGISKGLEEIQKEENIHKFGAKTPA